MESSATPIPDRAGGERRPDRGAIAQWAVPAFISCAVFAWLWFWRAGVFSGGDSEQWIREIDGGAWFQETQPGVFFLVQAVFQLIGTAFGGTSQMAFGLVSCAAGVATFWIVSAIFRDTEHRIWRMLVVCSAGFTTLFYGHLETYAAPAAALLFHLLCVKRSGEERWPVIAIPLSYALMVSLHLVALFAFPAMVIVTVLEARRRKANGRDLIALGLAVGSSLVIWMVIRTMGTGRSSDSVEYLRFLADGLFTEPGEMLRFIKPKLKVLFAFWNGGLACVLLPLAWSRRHDPIVRYGSIYLLHYLVFTVIWVAARQEHDFDLHSFPWLVMTLIAAWVYRPVVWARVALGLILTVNAGLWVSRPMRFADLPRPGTVEIELCEQNVNDEGFMLLDERLRLRPENRFIPAGAHEFSYYGRGLVLRESFEVERGKHYRLCVDGKDLVLEPMEE